MPLPEKNLLAEESSPYLLQHKDNPVHWRPWSAAALEEARTLQKPILLSVGYAACHWCHVMAHESFENQPIADAMNRYFVNIKVDREERPEIDQIYMAALSATGEQGGWPLTMFLDPDGNPFWGGTYFPPEQRYGRPGFLQVLEAVKSAWTDKKDELIRSANALDKHVRSRLSPRSSGTVEAPRQTLGALASNIHRMMDQDRGGLRGAPKFPNAPFMRVLWLDALLSGEPVHANTVCESLKAMLSGGIYDHVGGGLARYSTDDDWLVPHFEKMLYDNAQLLQMLCWAYGRTGDGLFRVRMEETVDWLLREMRIEDRAFASSLDADTSGVEGETYLWDEAEIERILGNRSASFFETFSLARPENWEGRPILHRRSHAAYRDDTTETALRDMLDELLAHRDRRPQPQRDDKILVDWNGMTISALANAGRALNREDWIAAADKAFYFVCESMEDGRLPHSIRDDNRLFPGLSSDYAAMISAAAALYQARNDAFYLSHARNWHEQLDSWYGDEEGTGHYLTAQDATDVPMRIRGDVDEALPSATGQVIEALLALSVLGGEVGSDRLSSLVERALARAGTLTYGQAGIIHASALAEQPLKLIMVDDPSGSRFIPVANRTIDPRRFDIVVSDSGRASPLPDGVEIDPGTPAAYLCIGQTCLPPIHTSEELERALKQH
ncbi:thioredoxin domain-containing protein [Nitratireductor sp. GISD-1A_MAKvit]|uniref:thioredoxin domain-containing protein n=1 Tax=Nitratireductor sp. GISD-1A_MAKvit TaxID=3234198 RepID=UPI0034655765